MKKVFTLILILSFSVSLAAASIELSTPADNGSVNTLMPVLKWKSKGMMNVYKVKIFSMETKSLLHMTYVKDKEYNVPLNVLQDGQKYLWEISGYQFTKDIKKILSKKSSPIWSFTVSSDGKEIPDYKKTGEILYIPVEFSDKKHKGNWYQNIKKKADEVFDFYKDISFSNKKLLANMKYDIFSEPITLKKTQENYGKDVKDGEKWIIDRGLYKKPWFGKGKFKGSHEMRRAALKHLFAKKVPVQKYKNLVYVVPGNNGNSYGSNQLWPVNNSSSPSTIVYVPFFKKVTGTYMSGIIIAAEKNIGTWRHEMGHALGLPDLYPRDGKYKKTDAGSNALMASGSAFDVGMTVISKRKGYKGALLGLLSTKKKEDWIKNKINTVTKSGTYTVSSRDSSGNLLCICVKLKTGGYYIVEVLTEINGIRHYLLISHRLLKLKAES